MKKIAHFAFAAALMAATAVGSTTLIPTSAVAMEKPWLIMTYLKNGAPVGNVQVFCNSPDIIFGDITDYDNIHYSYKFMCP